MPLSDNRTKGVGEEGGGKKGITGLVQATESFFFFFFFSACTRAICRLPMEEIFVNQSLDLPMPATEEKKKPRSSYKTGCFPVSTFDKRPCPRSRGEEPEQGRFQTGCAKGILWSIIIPPTTNTDRVCLYTVLHSSKSYEVLDFIFNCSRSFFLSQGLPSCLFIRLIFFRRQKKAN